MGGIALGLYVGITPIIVSLLISATIVEISGTAIITETSIIYGCLVVVIPTTMVMILVAGAVSIRVVSLIGVVLSFVTVLILPSAARRVRSVCRVVMWLIFFPWLQCFSGHWGWLNRIGSRLDLMD